MDYPFSYPVTSADATSGRATAARRAMTRVCATLYGAGAAIIGISLVTPQPHHVPVAALAATGAICAAIAAYLLLAPRVPALALLAMPPLGAIAISVLMIAEGTVTGSPFFYLWPGLIAACFLQVREVLLTIGWIGACFAAVLIGWVDTADGDAILFIDAFVAIGITSGLVFVLKTRVLALVDRLRDASRTEPLTGILNRTAFQEAIAVHEERARAKGTPFVIALMDLDHFKSVNDRLGHAAGDRALVRFVEIILGEKRHDDVLGRLGGEEFGLLLAATDMAGAHSFADRLRATVQAETARDEATLTVSVGIAEYRPGDTADDLLQAADQGLYAAKDAGRNRVVALDAVAEAA